MYCFVQNKIDVEAIFLCVYNLRMKKLYFRFFLTVLVLLPLVLLSSCFGSDFADLKVSASQTQSSAKAIYNTLEYNVDSELLKDEVKGTPEFVVTPSTYILDIDRIRLFNPIDKEDVTKGARESFEKGLARIVLDDSSWWKRRYEWNVGWQYHWSSQG